MQLLAQMPPELSALFTERTLVYATAGWLLITNLGRLLSAIRKGGGLISIWRGLIYGENTPKNKD